MFAKTQGIIISSKLSQAHIKQFIMALAIAILASLFMTANTHAAGTADIKEVFGATGNGITDDAAAIQAALDSDYDTLIFPEGDYLVAKNLRFTTSNKTILAEKATLFADSTFSYTDPGFGHDRHFVLIHDVHDITIKGLALEIRQKADTHSLHIMEVASVRQIHLDSCRFSAAPGIVSQGIVPLDFFSNWHDISVTNSTFNTQSDNAHDGGGSIYLRDIWGLNASNATITNNTVYKYSSDEIFWISEDKPDATIENVTVTNNRFYIGDPVLSKNTFTVALQTTGPIQISNVEFSNNEIIGQGTGKLFMFEGAENVEISDNDLYVKATPYNADTYAFSSIFGSYNPITGVTYATDPAINIHHNRTISLDSIVNIVGLSSGYGIPYNVTDNPRIIINAPSTEFLIDHKGTFANNNVIVNSDIVHNSGSDGAIISTTAKDVRNNHILINGYATVFIRNWQGNLAGPATYTGNTIIATKKRPTGTPHIARMWSFAMNGYPITINDNTFINGSEIEDDSSLETFTVANTGSNIVTDRTTTADGYGGLWHISATDAPSTNQTAYVCRNTFKGFRTKSSNLSPTIDLDCN